MPVRGSGLPVRMVHAAITTLRKQASVRPILLDVVLSLWHCGDMHCGDMHIACNPFCNPLCNLFSLHLFVVEGTLVMRPGSNDGILSQKFSSPTPPFF
jgi:hypothetical protein